MHGDIKEFCKLIGPWAPGLTRIVRTAIVTEHDSTHYLRYGRVWIDDQKIPPEPNQIVSAGNLTAIRETVEFTSENFELLILGLLERPAQLDIDPGPYWLSLDSPHQQTPNTSFYPMHGPRVVGQRRFPELRIIGTSRPAPYFDARAYDADLASHNPPYFGIEDLLRELDVDISMIQPPNSPIIQVMVRAPIDFDNQTRLRGNTLEVSILVPKALDPNGFNFGVILNRPIDNTLRFNITDPIAITVADESRHRISVTIDNHGAAEALIFAKYRGNVYGISQVLHERTRLNPLMMAHDFFFGTEGLKKSLPSLTSPPRGNDSQNFETLIALMLTLSGIHTIPYGQLPEMTEGPDLIAYTPGGDLLIIELTIGTAKPGKLLNLARRAEALRQEVAGPKSRFGAIYPVFVSSHPYSRLQSALEEARTHTIAVFAREDIERAAHELSRQRPQSAGAVRRMIQSRLKSVATGHLGAT